MKREKLLRSKDYVVTKLQLNLLNLIEDYMKKKNINRNELANELGVTKGYVSQVLNAAYDHKISKLVELALACNSMPLIHFVNLNEFIENDRNDKYYELFPIQRPMGITYESIDTEINKNSNKGEASYYYEYPNINLEDQKQKKITI